MPRASWAVGSDSERVVDVEDARLSMSALWTPTGPLTSQTGIVPGGLTEPGLVLASSPTPNGEVHQQPVRAVLQSTRGGGTYTLCVDEVEPVDVLGTAPSDPANDRLDLIVWQQSDTYFADADSQLRVRHVVGEPSVSPQDPEVDGSEDYVVRARITVPAGAETLTDDDIEVLPLPWTVATGGLRPVRSQTERETITSPYRGQPIVRTDRDWIEVHDSVAWRVQGVPTVSSAAGLAGITHPRSGMLVSHSGLHLVYRYAAGAWHLAAPRSHPVPTQTGAGALLANETATVASVQIPDLGVPYRIRVAGSCGSTTPVAGAPFDLQATANSAVWDTGRIGRAEPALSPVAGFDGKCYLPPQISDPVSGATLVRLLIRARGAAISVVNGTYYTLSVEALPALP